MTGEPIATFRGWTLTFAPNYSIWNKFYGDTVFVYRPLRDMYDTCFGSFRMWQRNRTLPELVLSALDHIQRAELKAAQDRNQIAMAKDLAEHIVRDLLPEES